MRDGEEVSIGQRIKVKSFYLPMILFNDEMATVVGITDGGQIKVRPDSTLENKALEHQTLDLFPSEVRDTNPYELVTADMRARIPEFNQPIAIS